MRALFVLLLIGLTGPALAEGLPTPAERGVIEQTIRSQMDAFQRDDAAGAFAYAAPGTQARFGHAEVFLEAVRHAYQPVYRPHGVDFTALINRDGETIQSVELIGPDGVAYTALYTMEREADGSWRIVACELVASQREGV